MSGFHDSKAFTFQDFHEPIMIGPTMSRILQESCVHCHAALVHDLVARTGREEDGVRCVHCHRSVGHGETTGLGR
jgi:cytochrome c nitrite reductase small subunit